MRSARPAWSRVKPVYGAGAISTSTVSYGAPKNCAMASPAFSGNGKYLFFVSDRTFNPSYNNLEWNHAYFDMSKLYLVTLHAEDRNPFAPKSDEAAVTDKQESNAKKEEPKAEKKEEKK